MEKIIHTDDSSKWTVSKMTHELFGSNTSSGIVPTIIFIVLSHYKYVRFCISTRKPLVQFRFCHSTKASFSLLKLSIVTNYCSTQVIVYVRCTKASTANVSIDSF